ELVVADERWPTAYLTGTVIRPAAFGDEPVRMQWIDSEAQWSTVAGATPDGRFRIGPLVAGTYQATVIGFRSKFGGLELGPYRVAAHEVLDVGRIVIDAPIVVELAPRVPAGHEIGPITARLLRG